MAKTSIPKTKSRLTSPGRLDCCVAMDGRDKARKYIHAWSHSRVPFSEKYLSELCNISMGEAARLCDSVQRDDIVLVAGGMPDKGKLWQGKRRVL